MRRTYRVFTQVIGWLVICGWQAILAGSAYLGGNMILALAELNHSSYVPALWQGTLVYWGVMLVAILINTSASKILPNLESFILILHLTGFLAVLVPLVSVENSPPLALLRRLIVVRWLERKYQLAMSSRYLRMVEDGHQQLFRFL